MYDNDVVQKKRLKSKDEKQHLEEKTSTRDFLGQSNLHSHLF